ncbi:MAG: ABC transporter ATP-binding protein [Opitutaceae bacterium]|nr:ABC transporter ATP-binding protein [Opitutaceae bacterium]
MSAEPPIVEFQSVAKRYGDGPWVLDRIDLRAKPGEFVSLIGPSGCGKSTLLRLIAGLSPISAGILRVADRSPEDAAAELAFVFQEPTLLPWLTVAANVELPLELRRMPAADRKTAREQALALVKLTGKEQAHPRQLSGGQKMRVSIARALTLNPRILLLDEPFGALDEMTREHLNEELLAIRAAQNWTAFFVTHSVAEAVFLSSRIIVMQANPGGIAHEIQVDLPAERSAETRHTRRYHELVAEVSRLLHSVEEN